MNLLSAEPVILQRLRESLQGVEVGSVAAIAGSLDLTKLAPFVFVQPGAAQPADTRGQGRAALEEQIWVAHLLVAAIPDKRFKDATYQEAGEYLGQIYEALVGWSIGPGFTPLQYEGRPEPHLDLGFAFFPISFKCSTVLKNL